MSAKQGSSKKSRTTARGRGSSVKTGVRGAKKNPQTPLALALMGKGPVKKMAMVACQPWRGVGNV